MNRRIDVVITVWDRALNYALEHRKALFPDAAIVSLVTRGRTLSTETPVVQIAAASQMGDTVEVALKLHGNIRGIAVVDGTLQINDDVRNEMTAQLARFAGRVKIEYLRDLPLDDLIERVKALPEDSVIVYARQSLKTRTQALTTFEGLQSVVAAARVPIYSVADQHVGYGVVGGVVFETRALAELVADSAMRLMKGAHARDMPNPGIPTVPMFDWRELQKWGIEVDQLPSGSEVLFREYAFWEQNGGTRWERSPFS